MNNSILVITPVFNEEKLLPLHYNYYNHLTGLHNESKMVYIDFGSTDNSVDLLESYSKENENVEYLICDTKEHREDVLMLFRNHYHKSSHYQNVRGRSGFKWVFTVDVDEFVYNKNLDQILDDPMVHNKSTIFRCIGYDLHFDNIPEKFNFSNLTSKYNIEGRRHKHLDKFLVFDPNYVDIRHDTGCHDANPLGYVKYGDTKLYNLQLKFLGKEYFIHVNKQKSSRTKKHAIETNSGYHYNGYLEDMEANPTWYEDYDKIYRTPLNLDD